MLDFLPVQMERRPEGPWTNALAAVLVFGALALLAATFVVGSTPDEEEFRFAVLSAWLRVDALRHGTFGFWTGSLGLGIPQPFTPAFLLHPLLPLLAVVSPVTWARVLLLFQALVGAAGMWQLARHLRLSALTSAVCIATFLLATPAQNYALTDFWPSHFIVWTSAPWLLWMAWRMLDADGHALRVWSLALGIITGLVVADTNPGHVVVYAPVVLAMAAAHWRALMARRAWVAVGVLIAAAIASPALAQLAHESPLFDPRLPKWSLPEALPAAALWNAVVSPLGEEIERTPFSRTLFFGGPFLVLALIGCVRFARRRLELVIIATASAILLFTSLLPFSFVSARYQFRDPLTLAAIPLAGLTLDALLANRARRAAAAVAIVAQVVVLCASAWPALARAWTGDARRAEWFRGATAAAPSADVLVNLARPAGRLLFSPAVDDEVYDVRRLWEGLGVNALAYRHVPVVNGWFKGVSAGAIWPDERQFYARIRTPRQLLDSPGTLDVLGIRYVLATPDEPPPANLTARGTVPTKYDGRFLLYENTDAWPGAFVLDATAETMPLERLPGCENDRVLCRDLSPLAGHRSPGVPLVRARDGDISIRMSASNMPRLLVVTQMFRDDWVASAEGGSVDVTPVFGGLIGVRVPPGVTFVRVRYRPVVVMLTTTLSLIVLAAGVTALALTRRGTPLPPRTACTPSSPPTASSRPSPVLSRSLPAWRGSRARG